jgi:hypothetical protein
MAALRLKGKQNVVSPSEVWLKCLQKAKRQILCVDRYVRGSDAIEKWISYDIVPTSVVDSVAATFLKVQQWPEHVPPALIRNNLY